MQLTIDDMPALAAMAEQRTGVLEFHCQTLGLFEGCGAYLEQHLAPRYQDRAAQDASAAPSVMRHMIGLLGDNSDVIERSHTRQQTQVFWENTQALCAEGTFRRAAADLDDKEAAVLGAAARHTIAQWHKAELREELIHWMIALHAKLVWAGGNSQFVDGPQAAKFPKEAAAAADLAYDLMRLLISRDEADYRQDIGNMLGQFVQVSQHAGFAAQEPESARGIAAALAMGSAAWATAQHLVDGSTPFKVFEPGQDLLLGQMPTDGDPILVGFNGNESLVTVAQPGAGKTQCHILPNLLTYDGSIVALDPKCELLELTAEQRRQQGKRILVLSLADDDVLTHRFNVMEFVDTRPEFLWNSLLEISEFLLPETPGDNNPVFRAKGAELFAVCLGGTVLDAIDAGTTPTLSAAIRQVFNYPEKLKDFLYDTESRACVHGCEPLEQSAAGLASLVANEDTTEDFLRFQNNATGGLTRYRGGLIERIANGPGDWRPEDLREDGTTLYIRIPYEEMSIYGGFIKLVLYTLIKRLRKGATEQGGLPITFLLDEVAQLGNLDQIANVVETGRGFGLRAWMILQDYDQARAASSKPNLILKTPKVRLFMNPTLETAQDISAELGKLNQIITGKEKQLAEPSELAGPIYNDKIVLLSSGSRPLSLKKLTHNGPRNLINIK